MAADPATIKFLTSVKKFLTFVNDVTMKLVTSATTVINAEITAAMPEIDELINVPMIGATVSRKNPANAKKATRNGSSLSALSFKASEMVIHALPNATRIGINVTSRIGMM